MIDRPQRTITILPDGSIQYEPALAEPTDGELRIVVEVDESEPLPPQFVGIIHALHTRNQELEARHQMLKEELPAIVTRRFDELKEIVSRSGDWWMQREARLKDALRKAMAYWARHHPDDVFDPSDEDNIDPSWGDAVSRASDRESNRDVTLDGEWRECLAVLKA